MDIGTYTQIRTQVIEAGFYDDIKWSESLKPPQTAGDFAREFIFVVCNSGMKFKVAVPIFQRIMTALSLVKENKLDVIRFAVRQQFGHEGKVSAIAEVWRNRAACFRMFKKATDKVAFCETLPWIGGITKYHLAKNLGVDCAKPDRHLERIAKHYSKTVDSLCADLAQKSGDRIATVDVVLWRAAAVGIINTKAYAKENT